MLQQNDMKPQERCGLCGVFGHPEAAKLAYFSLLSLQHRGQKSAGIATYDGSRTRQHVGTGLVSEVFTAKNLRLLKGDVAIGHVQDSDLLNLSLTDLQPVTVKHQNRTFSIAQNGSITNGQQLRSDLAQKGAIFHSSLESEAVVHLLARNRERSLDRALQSILADIKGGFSLLLMINDTLVAVRDPHGFRPLCLGRLHNGAYAVASETCAFDLIDAQYLRDIEPGEILLINAEGLRSVHLEKKHSRFCIFEQVYFARPDSDCFGINVYQSRKRMGEALAAECRIEADLVIPFPDSGICAALGYAQAAGLPFEFGLIRNHYVDRTLLASTRNEREVGIRMKLNPVRHIIRGKRVVIVDDSVVSGRTVKQKIRSLREAGALEVHLLLSCPPIRFPCHYGIHFPTESKLLITEESVEHIRGVLGLDTLHFLSLQGLLKAAGGGEASYCTACIDPLYQLECEPFPAEPENCSPTL